MHARNASGLSSKRLPIRTPSDLGPVADKLSTMFDTEVVVVVGSQAILVGWPSAPDALRQSDEIDAYPANYRAWEKAMNAARAAGEPSEEASEAVFAVAGEGSPFHEQWGFFVDGVNSKTSPLPARWQERAVYKETTTASGRTVTIVAPSPEDIIASKLLRLADKDRAYAELYHQFKPIDPVQMAERLRSCDVPTENIEAAIRFVDALPKAGPSKPNPMAAVARYVPEYPAETHCAFFNPADNSVIVRKWDADMGVFYKVDNPLGPAVSGKNIKKFALDGKMLDEQVWSADPSRDLEDPSKEFGMTMSPG